MDTPSSRQVAIVGRPNVGKSALFNRLAGRNIAIVHDQPGITRDRISAVSLRGDEPFTIWDTGGIGGHGETELLQEVRTAADAAMREADIILFVVDAQQGLTPIDQELARLLRRSKRPVVLVVNKIDHPKHEDLESEFTRLGFPEVLSISAAHGLGMSSLVTTIERLLPAAVATGEETPALSLAIVGRPNVGKSSLINAILSDRRTIVSDIPGTTRDAVDIAYRLGKDRFVLIDTAGIRPRGKHNTSVEVFSVMRAERTIRRADLCVLVVDATMGVTAQDKKIAALMQKAQKPSILLVNKWDLVKPEHGAKATLAELIAETRNRLFFLPYAPILVASALTGENVDRLFSAIRKIRRGAEERLSTGVLNRLLREAFQVNPPPMSANKRLKLFYATQPRSENQTLATPEFVLFVNDPNLLGDTYARYLEAQIREAKPFPGLPLMLNFRPRTETGDRSASRPVKPANSSRPGSAAPATNAPTSSRTRSPGSRPARAGRRGHRQK
ncbi:MAG: ribosome biogenesis GTPase Der [Chthoniobacterales bacterium]